MLDRIIAFLSDRGHLLKDLEAEVLIGTLVDKISSNEAANKLLQACKGIYDHNSYFRVLINSISKPGAANKLNLKTLEKGLVIVSEFIRAEGADCLKKKDYQLFVSTLQESSPTVMKTSLLVFDSIHHWIGADIWKRLPKELGPKEHGLLEK